MYKIAVIGDRDSIYGFAALGLDTYPVTDVKTVASILKELVERQYAVIYITEELYEKSETVVSKYSSNILPAIIEIPGISGNTGKGMSKLKKLVEQAVGSDIIFNDEN